jgi:hypothetical protein
MLKLGHAFIFSLFTSIENFEKTFDNHCKDLDLFIHLSLVHRKFLNLLHFLYKHIVNDHLVIFFLFVTVDFMRYRVAHLLYIEIHLGHIFLEVSLIP